MKVSLKKFAIFALGIASTGVNANLCQALQGQKAIDECYMKIALDYALIHNPRFPFGALIVDHTKNDISCYGANSNKKNKLLHGETAAFWNCTELCPSPTNDDMFDPGLHWSHQTLYTTGEPCPMCASQSIYRGVSRVVWGTSILDINKSGRQQLMISMHDVVASARLGADLADTQVPTLEGGILKDECDHAFWCAFEVFRDDDYFTAMARDGNEKYIDDRNARFKCKTVPKNTHDEL
ncbi:cytidine deaminase-like protein [Parasitella parasitica]|nr:cytidine deaminase-like protein [Parasitella parasitica]